MKVLAMHLPQYHEIPENDAWWGKGFTDWTNVRKAKPLYKGHRQPAVPRHQNYYDMTDLSTLVHQAELAQQYSVYGFCYYHYWFNGKLLLEKPCELLLAHPEIKEHYCFCWANESWARTWDGRKHDYLIRQEYGGEEDWKKHIAYLLPFFRDRRYIRINDRPVLFFYSCSRIPHFPEMLACWNEELKKEGFGPLYVAEFVNSFDNGKQNIPSDVLVEFEPHAAARYAVPALIKAKRVLCKKLKQTDFLSYDRIWNAILNNREDYGGKKLWRSGFVGFDNSPRKGKQAMIIKGQTPEKFEHYLRQLLNSHERNYDDRFCIINAWNEWAEGAVLEPSEQDGYAYLEAVKRSQE